MGHSANPMMHRSRIRDCGNKPTNASRKDSTLSIRLTDIRGLERAKTDALRTTVLTAGILAVAYVVVAAIAVSQAFEGGLFTGGGR